MNSEFLDKLFAPVEETGDDQRIHVWVGIIALILIGFLFGIKVTFGNRAV